MASFWHCFTLWLGDGHSQTSSPKEQWLKWLRPCKETQKPQEVGLSGRVCNDKQQRTEIPSGDEGMDWEVSTPLIWSHPEHIPAPKLVLPAFPQLTCCPSGPKT